MQNFIGDIFSLNDVYERQTTEVDVAVVEVNPVPATVFTEINAKSNIWSNSNTHAWFAGAANPPLVDRVDFFNDSFSGVFRTTLSIVKTGLTATGNFNYGWFGGGSFPAPLTYYSSVDRIDYSNDSSAVLIRGSLSVDRGNLAATGNYNYGWFGSGNNAALISTVDRIDFSNDSLTASVRGPLSLGRQFLSATGNSDFGWFSGGVSTTNRSTVERVDFSNDSAIATIRGPLTLARRTFAATGNSEYGWFGGGQIPAPLTYYTLVDRIDYSNDSSSASVKGPLSLGRSFLSAEANTNYGWFGGGYIAPLGLSTVDRIDFSNDYSTASVRGPLTLARAGAGSASGQAKSLSISLLKTGSYGWFGGGAAGTPISSLDRVDFSNDSVSTFFRGPLSSAKYEMAATGNSNYGWFATGRSGAITTNTTTVDRIDFSNNSPWLSTRGPLNIARFYTAGATSNSNYGWFGGGSNDVDGSLSTVERINFSNDSVIASVRGSLYSPAGRTFLAATGNFNYGWFGGGAPGVHISTIERIQYSNDLAIALQRTPLIATRYKSAAVSNSNYGWWGAGCTQPPQIVNSIVDRIDFSNDSLRSLVRGPLTLSRAALAAAGNSDYGWFGGGNEPNIPETYSKIDRIDFSNDSITASVRDSLTTIRRSPAATSNTTLG
jgi:hypothetical protein